MCSERFKTAAERMSEIEKRACNMLGWLKNNYGISGTWIITSSTELSNELFVDGPITKLCNDFGITDEMMTFMEIDGNTKATFKIGDVVVSGYLECASYEQVN